MAHNGSVRECDIILKDKIKSKKIILDPTIRFEISRAQPEDINYKNILIYNPSFQQLHISKQNILLDIFGTIILKFYSSFWYQYKFV